jgi:hypothetical protein
MKFWIMTTWLAAAAAANLLTTASFAGTVEATTAGTVETMSASTVEAASAGTAGAVSARGAEATSSWKWRGPLPAARWRN